MALKIDTGELVWGSQAIPHDIFDRDAMLTGRVDVKVGGKARSLAISTGKLGVVQALDADTGKQVWRTEVGTHQNDELTEITGKTLVYPGSLGGVQTPMAVADGETIGIGDGGADEGLGAADRSFQRRALGELGGDR